MKILYVTTVPQTMNFFKFLISKLVEEGHQVDIACNTQERAVDDFFLNLGCRVYPISCTRSPINVGNIKAIRELKHIVKKGKYDIVHCHTPIAAACTRLACINARKKGTRVIYTAHGFHFYKGAPLKNWIIYFPVEKVCSYMTDVLITINTEDYAFAKHHMNAKQTVYIPGVGIDLEKFKRKDIDKKSKKAELGLNSDDIVLFSVGELNHNKNHELVIKALHEIGDSRIHYLIAGVGVLKEYLQDLSEKYGLSNNVHLLGYRKDISELCQISDLFVFPSIREGLGVALMEAMACKTLVIASNSRGPRDLIKNEKYLFSPYDFISLAKMIKNIIGKKLKDENNNIIDKNYSHLNNFSIEQIYKKMMDIYKSI